MKIRMVILYATVVVCISLMSALNEGYAESAAVSVCPGGQLNLTCDTTETILTWIITFPHRPGDERRLFLAGGDADSALPLTVDQTTFQFLRTSTMPLISLMVISNVNTILNGTRVDCSYGSGVMLTHIINVIGSGIAAPGPIVISKPEQFRNETITVFVKWTAEENYDTINPSVSPLVTITESNGTSAQLILSYNTLYSVNVTATLCGQSSSSSATELLYVKCDPPLTEENERYVIANYSYPALEGTNVTFTCNDPGLLFNGSNLSTCMGNGEWEPDPVDVKCIPKAILDCGMPIEDSNDITITYNSSTATLRCREGLSPTDVVIARCYDNGSWIPDPADFHCTSSDMKTSNTSAIIGGTLGVLFGILLALCVIAIFGSVFWFKTRSMRRPQSKNDVQTHTQELSMFQHGPSTSDDSEYSKLQHNLPQHNGANDVSQGGLYADLGPMSKKVHVQTPTIHDDSRVVYADLNHQSSTKQQKVSDELRTVDKTLNLDCLLIQLQSKVTRKWYEFGEALGIGTEILNRYAECTPDQSMIEVCDYWFRTHMGQPTWREVANALKKIKFQQLAFDIESVYETGKLPVNVKDILEVPFTESEDEPPPPVPPRVPL